MMNEVSRALRSLSATLKSMADYDTVQMRWYSRPLNRRNGGTQRSGIELGAHQFAVEHEP